MSAIRIIQEYSYTLRWKDCDIYVILYFSSNQDLNIYESGFIQHVIENVHSDTLLFLKI